MLGCKMASQTCEPVLFGGGEITGRNRCVVIFLYEVMSLKRIWSLCFKTSPGRGGNLRRVIEGEASVMTRTISHSERDNLLRAPGSGWGNGPHKRPLLSISSVEGRPQGCEGRGRVSLQIWAWDGGYTFQTLPSPLFLFFLTLPG